jgi:hypothetical protein
VALVMTVVLLVAGQLVGGAPAFLALLAVFPGGLGSLADRPLAAGLATGALIAGATGGVFVLLWAWLKWFEKRPFHTLGFERAGWALKYARGFAVGLGMLAASVGLSAAFGYVAAEPEAPGVALVPGLAAGVLAVLMGWLVQGASEEALTRGWLMGVIGARYRPWAGVLVSSLAFAGLHGLNPNVGPVALLNLFLFGVFSALYALREGGLWGVCAEHAAWNWAQGNVLGFEVSGAARAGPILLDLKENGPDLVTGGAFGPEGGLAVTAVLVVVIAALALWPARAPANPSGL